MRIYLGLKYYHICKELTKHSNFTTFYYESVKDCHFYEGFAKDFCLYGDIYAFVSSVIEES